MFHKSAHCNQSCMAILGSACQQPTEVYTFNLSSVTINDTLKEKLKSLKAKLTLDKTTLTKHRQTLISADDDRMGPVLLGAFFTGLLFTSFVFVILFPDLVNLVTYIQEQRNALAGDVTDLTDPEESRDTWTFTRWSTITKLEENYKNNVH